jgi:peptidoglycan L-alanyl-D-glutamate endopeptidase CwlK
MPKFGKKSLENREMLCKDLRRLVDEVIKYYDFSIICSHRDRQEQENAYLARTSNAHFGQSAHNYFPAFAVDVYPYPVPKKQIKGIIQVDSDSKEWEKMIFVFKNTAKKMGIKIDCGIDFKKLVDKPHIEIKDWKEIVKEI